MSKPTPVITDVTGKVPNGDVFKASRATVNGCSDRISRLPEDIIINNIFSLLGDNDIPRLMIVSKHFRRLAISTPFLSLKHCCILFCNLVGEDRFKYCKGFHNFLQNLMLKRLCITPLRALTLHCSCNRYQTTLFSFLDHVAECGTIEKLELHLRAEYNELSREFMIMKHLLRVPSLKVVKFDQSYEVHAVMNSASPLTSLQVIILERLPSFNEYPMWISHATSLKCLIVRCCIIDGNFDLVSSSLEYLEFCEVSQLCSLDRSNMSISCPKLESLKFDCVNFDKPSIFTVNDACCLKCLSIRKCQFFQDLEDDILSTACACASLETLRIDQVRFYLQTNLIIASPFLKEMILRSCKFEGDFDRITIKGERLSHLTISECSVCSKSDGYSTFDIIAPNLQEGLSDDSVNVNFMESRLRWKKP